MVAKPTILSIGHSAHSWKRFGELLQFGRVTAIADVRSAPCSRRTPHFNRDELKVKLREIGIVYSFLGRELGGRPKGQQFYCDGIADYEKMAQAPLFKEGIARVINGAKKYRIALLCSEHDPLDCHRCLLVGRELNDQGINIEHILSDGSIQNQLIVEDRLMRLLQQDDLFIPRQERLAIAYRERNRKVAFVELPRHQILAAE